MNNKTALAELIPGEVAGKYTAERTYDGNIFKTHSGCSTQVVVGWSVLLRSIVDHPERSPSECERQLQMMLVVSARLGIGTYEVERSEMLRRFPVIWKRNELMHWMGANSNDLSGVLVEHLDITGNGGAPVGSNRFRQTFRAERCVCRIPVAAVAAVLVLRQQIRWTLIGIVKEW